MMEVLQLNLEKMLNEPKGFKVSKYKKASRFQNKNLI